MQFQLSHVNLHFVELPKKKPAKTTSNDASKDERERVKMLLNNPFIYSLFSTSLV